MPKIVQYNLPPGGTVIDLADNQSTALEIEQGGADYLTISTVDGSENLTIGAGPSRPSMVRFKADDGSVQNTTSGGWYLDRADASATNPVFVPKNTDTDTGIGSSGADALSLIAGGVEGIRLTEDTTVLAEIKGRTVITADTSGTPDDLGDFDNYALVLQGSSNDNDETALLLSSSSNTYGGSAIVHKDTGGGGKGELNFYTKQATGTVPPTKVMTISDSGVCALQATSAIHYNAGTGSDTATTEPVYLADTNATMIVDFSNGNVGDITLAANVTAVKFWNVPADGTTATITAKITQDSSARTFDYSDSAVTVYSDGGSTAVTGEIKFSGGAHHVQSTGSGAVDLVSFTCIPSGSTFNIYAAVIGQAFA